MKLTKKQIEMSIEIVDAIDKAKAELEEKFERFDEKTAASITYHLIYPKGREVTSLN